MNLLSIVLAARNDNYGGDFLVRLRRSVDSIIYGAETWGIPVEIVIVEWNPPQNRPMLREALSFSSTFKKLILRVITVPAEYHNRFGVKIPLIEYVAKNVGIRRAKGDFILVTNPDIFFPAVFFEALAKEVLETDAFYRIDRIDVSLPGADFDSLSHVEKEQIISNAGIQAHVRSGSFSLSSETPTPATVQESGGVSIELPLFKFADIYTNASGDFLLASRAAWFAIGGFKETNKYFTTIDSICCLQMVSLGLRQRVFSPPCRIWHFDHSRDILRLNVDPAYQDYAAYLEQLSNGISIIPINKEGWGFADVMLPEQSLLIPQNYSKEEVSDKDNMLRQVFDMLCRIPKRAPLEKPVKHGTVFLYETGMDKLICFPRKNPPDYKRACYRPLDEKAHLYTPFFLLPDASYSVQTLSLTVRFATTGLATDYRCIIQDENYASLAELFFASGIQEQEHHLRIAYTVEQPVRIVLMPASLMEYALPVFLRVDTDALSYAVRIYKERDMLLSSHWRKLGLKLKFEKKLPRG
jgi:hypothetical protein